MEQQHVAIAPASSSRKSGICLIQQGCEDSRGSWPPWWRDAASRALQEDRDRGPQTCPSTCTGLSLENKQIWKFKILLLHKWTLINQWSSSTVLWYLYLNFQTGKVSQSVQSVSHVQPFATPWIAARLPVHHQLLEFTQTRICRKMEKGRTNVEAETPILWPPDVKSWLIWKDPDAGKDWRWEEKGDGR